MKLPSGHLFGGILKAYPQSLALLAAALASLFSDRLAAQERFTLSGRELTIYNLAGDVELVSGSGNVTELEIRRIGRDAARLQLVPGADGSTFHVIYPASDIAYPGPRRTFQGQFTTTVADDGGFGRNAQRGRRVRISSLDRAPADALEAGADILVRVPAGVRVRTIVAVGNIHARDVSAGLDLLNTSSGGIDVERVRGDITLSTNSGSVNVTDVEGNVTLRARSGAAELRNARGGAIWVKVLSGGIRADQLQASKIELETASGPIDLQVPANMGATLELETGSGRIDVTGPMTITSKRTGYTAVRIGDGRARLTAKTGSGNVTASSRSR
jgi:hypothetical protein